jgi:hypothetical protein
MIFFYISDYFLLLELLKKLFIVLYSFAYRKLSYIQPLLPNYIKFP